MAPPLPRARERLIDAAMRVFSRSGDRSVNLSRLARDAGVARGTIYAHLPDSDRLFEIVAEAMAERIEAEILSRWLDVNDPLMRVALFLATFLRLTHDDYEFGRYMVRFAPSTPALHRSWADLIPDIVRQAIAAGQLAPFPDGIGYFVQFLSGATYSSMMLVSQGRATWRDAAHHLIVMSLMAGGVERDRAAATAAEAINRMARDELAVA